MSDDVIYIYTPSSLFIVDFRDSISTGSQTMDRRKHVKVKEQSKNKRFSVHGKLRKKSQQVIMTSIGAAADEEIPSDKGPYNYQNIAFSSDDSSLMTSLNWSVPSDLPAVVTQQTSNIQSGPTSLENLTITLEPDATNLDRFRCASNPDIVDEKRRSRRLRPRIPSDFYSVSDIQRSPSSTGPKTCDVSVQVDSKQVFTFPTPPNSVSPTLPFELYQQLTSPHHAVLHLHKSTTSTPTRHQDQCSQELPPMSHHSPSFDIRHSGGSFPFVPEEDEEIIDDEKEDRQHKNGLLVASSSATEVIQEEVRVL